MGRKRPQGHPYRDTLNWENLNIAQYPGSGPYGIPKMLPCSRVEVSQWIGFPEASACLPAERRRTGVHFWQADSCFKQVWNQPRRYLALLMQFGAVCSPEFSVYDTFPAAVRIYNMYRNAWLARYWSEAGVNVVPSILWSYAGDADFIWDCYPENSIVALSTVGCMKNTAQRAWLERGVREMQERLHPEQVLLHGLPPSNLTVESIKVETFTDRMLARIHGGAR